MLHQQFISLFLTSFKLSTLHTDKTSSTGIGCQMKNQEYAGLAASNASGHACQRWSSTPRQQGYADVGHHNYCRNPKDPNGLSPDGRPGGVWCFTSASGQTWDYCSVPQCDSGDLGIFNRVSISGCPPTGGRPATGVLCDAPDQRCGYGEECCCGECGPLDTMTCVINNHHTEVGTWQHSFNGPCQNATCGKKTYAKSLH